MRPSSIGASLFITVAALPFISACAGDGPGATNGADVPDRRGASLVVGTTADRRGLLVIPREGGPATLRGLVRPADSLWSGSASLPAAVDARALGATVVLLDRDGVVHRYGPARDRLEEVGRISPEATWTASGGRGVYAYGDRVLQLGDESSRSDTLPRAVRWASPAAEGRLAVLLEAGEGPSLRVYPAGAGEAEAGASPEVSLPALSTAWGTRLAFRSATSNALVLLALPGLEEVARWTLPATPDALAASPSTHRIYAGLENDAGILSIRRFGGSMERLADVGGPILEIRPSLFGGGLIVATRSAVWYLGTEEAEPARLPTEWRTDLPLGLPGDRVLVVRDGEVALWSTEAPEARPLEAPADAWWLPVQWRPVRPAAFAARTESEDAAEESPAAPDRAAEPEESGSGAEDERPAPEARTPGPDAGYYAIVASSQSRSGVTALVDNLTDAGYRATVQRHRDEASELWYRALVGPYPTRERAQEAARQLRRERGLEAWISEVGPGARADGNRPLP